jgi:hypothetical protein
MRYSLLISIFALIFIGCNKDKYTSAPQISFKSLKPDVWDNSNLDPTAGPVLTLELTDAEGDFGFNNGIDTSYAYIKNITIPPYRVDSVKFPNLPSQIKKNLKVDVDILLRSVLANSGRPRPFVDTLYFEVYVKDFAKNKSNVIKTDKPVYLIVN